MSKGAPAPFVKPWLDPRAISCLLIFANFQSWKGKYLPSDAKPETVPRKTHQPGKREYESPYSASALFCFALDYALLGTGKDLILACFTLEPLKPRKCSGFRGGCTKKPGLLLGIFLVALQSNRFLSPHHPNQGGAKLAFILV